MRVEEYDSLLMTFNPAIKQICKWLPHYQEQNVDGV